MDQVPQAATLLLNARRSGDRLAGLPEGARPQTEAEAYRIQAALIEELGGIAGWKVGSPSPTAAAFTCAPIPRGVVVDSPATIRGSDRSIEAEIAVRLGADLPARAEPYTASDIDAAIASAHPAIEVLQSRFADPEAVDKLSGLADSMSNHSLVVGAAIADWRRIDLAQEEVLVLVAEREIKRRIGNPAGGMTRLLLWLANTGARWAGGLRAGQVVTTGSWTGKDAVGAGEDARVRFAHGGEAVVRFAP